MATMIVTDEERYKDMRTWSERYEAWAKSIGFGTCGSVGIKVTSPMNSDITIYEPIYFSKAWTGRD